MRVLKLAAAAAVFLMCAGSAEAARHRAWPGPVITQFCGDRPCPVYQDAGGRNPGFHHRSVRFRADRPKRSRTAAYALKRHGRHADAGKARPRDLGQAWRGLPVFLAAFRAPSGAVCVLVSAPIAGGVNMLQAFRAHIASIVAPVRPGYVEVRAASGARAVLAEAVAPRFVGLLRDLEAGGYRVLELGGYAYRRIAGTRTLSKHAFGRALDVNQEERDRVSVPMDRRLVSKLAAANGLCSGGDWRHGDLGHFEECGPSAGGARRHRHYAKRRSVRRIQYAGAAPPPVPW